MSAPGSPSRLAIVGLMVAMFLAAVDATIVGTAMPTVVAAIGGLDLYPWAFTSFMLTATIATPFYGKFADLYGVRRCYFVAIAVFLLGSVACALATHMPSLVGARAVQGLGAGGLTTLTFIAFGHLFPPESRGKAQGFLSMVWGVSSLVGPLAGGLMVATFHWSWIFWINLPVSLVAVAMVAKGLPKHEAERRAHSLDWPGAVWLVGGLFALMLAMGSETGPVLAGWPIGLVLLALFIRRQLRAPEPLVPLTPFQSPLFAISTALGFGTCLTMFAALTYVPLYVQGAMGKSAPEAGMVLTPMMVSWPIAGALAGQLVNRVGFRALVLTGSALMLAGFSLLAWPGGKGAIWMIALQASLLGGGMGLITATTMISAQVSVPKQLIGVASSSVALVRNIGAALGLSLLGGIQLVVLRREIAEGGVGLDASQQALLEQPQRVLELAGRGELPEVVWTAFRAAMSGSLHTVFAISVAVAALCVALAWFMPPLSPKEAAERVAQAG